LHDLVKEGAIKRVGRKAGIYCRVDKNLALLNPFDAENREHPIQLPLNLGDLVKVYPKSLIVVAGGSNAGKTAFMLNVVRINLHLEKILYFSSELGAEMLHSRIAEMELLPEWYEAFKTGMLTFVEWKNNLDALDPDAINIIDFLTPGSGGEFWQIGLTIEEIFRKLNRGVTLVAIQKPPGRELGYGGDLTQHYASLYVALANTRESDLPPGMPRVNIAKIVKGKAWKNPLLNPNGLTLYYKLIRGWRFDIVRNWE